MSEGITDFKVCKIALLSECYKLELAP